MVFPDSAESKMWTADNFLVKRFYNFDHNAHLEGSLPREVPKELMWLVASPCPRCDDCINYHVIQCYRLGVTRADPGGRHQRRLVVGGSIVISHMRDLSNQSHVWRRCVSHNRYIAISYVSLGHPRR